MGVWSDQALATKQKQIFCCLSTVLTTTWHNEAWDPWEISIEQKHSRAADGAIRLVTEWDYTSESSTHTSFPGTCSMWGRFRLSYTDPVTFKGLLEDPDPADPGPDPESPRHQVQSPQLTPHHCCGVFRDQETNSGNAELRSVDLVNVFASEVKRSHATCCHILPLMLLLRLLQQQQEGCWRCQTSSQVKGQFQDSVYNHDVSAFFLTDGMKTKVMIKRELEQTSGD